LLDWPALGARSAEDWQTAGAGRAKSAHLAAFFEHPEVRAHAARLHAIGVQGF
jgi:DNA ligase (NAD+)